MDKGRIQKALDALVYLPHLKEKALHAAISPVREEEGGKGRVWDSGDLFRRLQTYKPATWFCKPDAISPAECARRGWLNTAADMLTCEVRAARAGVGAAVVGLLPKTIRQGQVQTRRWRLLCSRAVRFHCAGLIDPLVQVRLQPTSCPEFGSPR